MACSAAVICAAIGCSSSQTKGARHAQVESIQPKEQAPGRVTTEAELEDTLVRWASTFSQNLREAFRNLEASSSGKTRRLALNQRLLYDSSFLDTALGPIPEANVLDLVALIEICTNVLRNYWIPQVFGEGGRPVLQAFVTGREELRQIASRIMNAKQLAQLDSLIQSWQADHPGQIAVEGVRLTDFAEEFGAKATQREKNVQGLLSEVSHAAASTDQAVLLGERALYYAQRAPFLYRLHAKVATSELVDTAGAAAQNLPFSGRDLDRAHSLMGEFSQLLKEAQITMRDGGTLTDQIRSLMRLIYKNRDLTFSRLRNDALAETSHSLREYNEAMSSPGHAANMAVLQEVPKQLDSLMSRLLLRIVAAAAALILFGALIAFLTLIGFQKWRDTQALKRQTVPGSHDRAA